MMTALDADAEDVTTDEQEILGVTAEPSNFIALKTVLEDAGYELVDSAIRYIPNNSVEVDEASFGKINDLMDAIEDNDDVQDVHHNAELAG
jgi:transcriptional/translational regulatory protein YebC/TACO1